VTEAIDGHSLRFTKIEDHGRVAFEAYVAIYRNDGKNHIVLGSPTVDGLAKIWFSVAGVPLDREKAQRVRIIKA